MTFGRSFQAYRFRSERLMVHILCSQVVRIEYLWFPSFVFSFIVTIFDLMIWRALTRTIAQFTVRWFHYVRLMVNEEWWTLKRWSWMNRFETILCMIMIWCVLRLKCSTDWKDKFNFYYFCCCCSCLSFIAAYSYGK